MIQGEKSAKELEKLWTPVPRGFLNCLIETDKCEQYFLILSARKRSG